MQYHEQRCGQYVNCAHQLHLALSEFVDSWHFDGKKRCDLSTLMQQLGWQYSDLAAKMKLCGTPNRGECSRRSLNVIKNLFKLDEVYGKSCFYFDICSTMFLKAIIGQTMSVVAEKPECSLPWHCFGKGEQHRRPSTKSKVMRCQFVNSMVQVLAADSVWLMDLENLLQARVDECALLLPLLSTMFLCQLKQTLET